MVKSFGQTRLVSLYEMIHFVKKKKVYSTSTCAPPCSSKIESGFLFFPLLQSPLFISYTALMIFPPTTIHNHPHQQTTHQPR
jgi:hypothetical protein